MAAEFELVYSYGVDVISLLQSSFPDSEKFFMDVSTVFDPKYVFTLFFPVVFALQWAVGVKLFATIVAVEWLNQILKWLMHGDRPYWWVHEVETQHNSTNLFPEIFQYASTCETGPGMPSGHAMATSAAWYVLVQAAIDNLVTPSKMSSKMKSQVTSLLWAGYGVILTLVVLSRMYIAAHFPHQCFLGILLGVICARYIYGASKWLNLKRREWMLLSAFVLASAVGTYSFLLLTGSDPAWSISRAMKWCVKREYIHVDTTPFYSLSRYSGAAFGLGLGLTSRFFTAADFSRFSRTEVVMTMLFGLAAGHLAAVGHVAIPKTNEQVFYTLEFTLNCLLPYAVVALAPFAAKSLSGSSKVKSS